MPCCGPCGLRMQATFAGVYAWTHAHMTRPDHLLAWHWGRRPDGSWGVLDANTASDGDLDYALALALAARRGWRAPTGPAGLSGRGPGGAGRHLGERSGGLARRNPSPHPGQLA